jgi:2-phospho-L-lactate transferase/gluconeogenesis factor (CofD/UPF0052 family)/isopentenyldiphosphate isomerase
MQEELLAAIDELGNLLPRGVSRSEAHKRGIWHRTVGIFVLNSYGEVLVERRSKNKDLFPDCYDIPGGHVDFGSSPVATAINELNEELELNMPFGRMHPLTAEDAVVERVVIPDKGIINLERKTVYVVVLSDAEEKTVLSIAARLAKTSAEDLAEMGPLGEVSRIEFWSWEHLLGATTGRGQIQMASGTESALAHALVRASIAERCLALRRARLTHFWDKYGTIFSNRGVFRLDDLRLADLLLDRFSEAPDHEEVATIFEDGTQQLAGAYQIGPFRLLAAGHPIWDAKIHDPETTYVENIITAIARGTDARTTQRLLAAKEEIADFVCEVINLPLSNGQRFRDSLGNLVDIAAARRVVLLWLEFHASDVLSREELRHPLQRFVEYSIEAGRILLADWNRRAPSDGKARVRELLSLGLGAASIDFNTPDLQTHMPTEELSPTWMANYARVKASDHFCAELGSDQFYDEFYRRYIISGRRCSIVFLPGNSAQAYLSLAICQELLEQSLAVEILFIPKSGAPGNDLTFRDAQRILADSNNALLNGVKTHLQQGRFKLVHDGPSCHGLDPAGLSREAVSALRRADVVFAEGQAYAEISGWKKPVYVAYRVNGRVAEAIHGVSRRRNASGFVRLTPGVDHFEDFTAAVFHTVFDPVANILIPTASQTTSDYVSAILGENSRLLVARLFHGDEFDCYRQVRREAKRLNKTFASVLIGVATHEPDEAQVRTHYANTHYPVFACGGGGGFNGVTLKALRMLGLPVVAGVPSTDDGGSSGDLQKWFQHIRGFVFGVGDMAAILQDALEHKGKQALLAYRFEDEPNDLPAAVLNTIVGEIANPTYPESAIGGAPDFLSFAANQLSLARVIDQKFRLAGQRVPLPVKGSSIRNLNVIAAHELCGCLGDARLGAEIRSLSALYVLEKALGVPSGLVALPVTYESCALYVDYEQAIPHELARTFQVPPDHLQEGGHRLVGQRYIDKLPVEGRRIRAGVVRSLEQADRPRANPYYLARLSEAKLFIMGAGSLFSSQLAQLAVAGVVDALLACQHIRRILVLNHVRMDETLGMSLRDHIEMVEIVATDSASDELLKQFASNGGRLPISSLFTDIVVPRTVARDVEEAMAATRIELATNPDQMPPTVEDTSAPHLPLQHLNGNRHLRFLAKHPEVTRRLQITERELEVLSYLEQAPGEQVARTELGRYRGALFSTVDDVNYLVAQGIQRRSIHEIDSIGENWKIVKAAGTASFEFFPGLVPEALLAIVKIALERGVEPAVLKSA